jgi:hypothetical protein
MLILNFVSHRFNRKSLRTTPASGREQTSTSKSMDPSLAALPSPTARLMLRKVRARQPGRIKLMTSEPGIQSMKSHGSRPRPQTKAVSMVHLGATLPKRKSPCLPKVPSGPKTRSVPNQRQAYDLIQQRHVLSWIYSHPIFTGSCARRRLANLRQARRPRLSPHRRLRKVRSEGARRHRQKARPVLLLLRISVTMQDFFDEACTHRLFSVANIHCFCALPLYWGTEYTCLDIIDRTLHFCFEL